MPPHVREMERQLETIKALLDDLGIPPFVTFAEAPHKKRTDLPARVKWALIVCSLASRDLDKVAP